MTASPILKSPAEYKILEVNGENWDNRLTLAKIDTKRAKRDFREDIALLRGLAIVAVLGYHFWPALFPLGFIGVDVFFVISGYLIMTILARSKGRPHEVVIDFYYRRLKRICPLFYFVFFLAGFCAMFVYTAVWAKRYFSYYLSSILFFLNLNMLQSDGDYFAEATEEMPFLHSWSLAVEIQFYVIAPIIFFVSKLKIKELPIGPIFVGATLVSSLIFQYSSTSIVAFYHPFSRLWQFLVGMLAALYSNKSNEEPTNKRMDIFSSILISSVLIMFFPFISRLPPPNFPQFLVTVTSGAFMMASSFGSVDWSIFRLGYTATISYALYLVHFPVLRFSEYLAELNDFTVGVHFIALFLTVVISIFLHHFYEKPQLGETRTVIVKECLKYLALSVLIALKWESVVHPECAQKSTLAENAKFVHSMYKMEGGAFVDDGFGRHKVFGHYRYKNGTGKHRVVIVGNSWATQQAHIVRKIIPESYTETMDSFTWASDAIVFHYSPNRTEFFWDYVEKTKPDIVFLLLRYHYMAGDLKPFKGKENDTAYLHYLEGVKRLSKFASHIFIETHQPFICVLHDHDFLNHFMDMISKGKDMEKAYQPFNAETFDNSSVHQRLDALMEECPKCHPLNLAEPFIDRQKKRVITFDSDKMLSYYDNDCHLTASGLKMIEKPFRETVERVLRLGKE